MTSVLNFVSSSSSNSTTHLQPLAQNQLLSNVKYPTTFIVQPPSSSQNKPNVLLTKRYKPSELGEMLMKKIKSQPSNSSETFEDAVYDSPTSKNFDSLECHSMIEEERSPKSTNGQKTFEDVLIPQRSMSTPSFFSSIFFSAPTLPINDSQKQVQQALETLQKKILLEQQAAALREVIKAQFSKNSLSIPPLHSSSQNASSKSQDNKKIFKSNGDGPEIIYGEVEFPFLSMSAPQNTVGILPSSSMAINKPKALGKRQKKSTKDSSDSSPAYESGRQAESSFNDIRDSLTATRAETQRSESELGSSLRELSEEFAQLVNGKRRKTKKAASVKSSEGNGKGKKAQKKEKKQEKAGDKHSSKDDLFPPRISTGRRLAERKLNKWQMVQSEKQDKKPKENSEPMVEETDKNSEIPVGTKHQVDMSTLSAKGQQTERRTPKMKWDPLSQDEGELHNFFEELRNLLNNNVDQEKAIQMLKENDNDVQKVLELVKANKDQYIGALAM